MSRGCFEVLLNGIQNIIINDRANEAIIPLQKKLLFTFWMLSKKESFKSAGDRFDMAKSTAHNVFMEIISLIANLRREFIRWPNNVERAAISQDFENVSGIPGIVGAVDGCRITIQGPPHNAIDYYNRNNYHSVILQGVCNHKREFIDIFVGMPGRVHDARVFRTSPLHTALTANEPLSLNDHQHLIGDAAYPLSLCLMIPYRDNGHLTQRQTLFNTRLSSVRVRIEQAFGLLKSRFRRLKFLEMGRVDLIPTTITTACALHNLTLQYQSSEELLEDDDDDVAGGANMENDEEQIAEEEHRNEAAECKRNYLASLLM